MVCMEHVINFVFELSFVFACSRNVELHLSDVESGTQDASQFFTVGELDKFDAKGVTLGVGQ